MKKKLIFIFSIMMAIVMFAGCTGYNQKAIEGGPALSDPVSNNESFVVSKGDYYYYINGKAEQADDNKWGNPQKGAIMRTKKSELRDASLHQTIVPKIALNSYADAGFSIFGEYIYFTSPNDEKNKNGEVEYTYLDFMRVKLNGTNGEKLFTHSSASLQHKYYEIDNVVYLVYSDTVDGSTKLYALNCSTKEKKELVGEYTGTAYFMKDKVVFLQNVYRNILSKEENETMTAKEQAEKADEFEIAPYNKMMSVNVATGEKVVVKKDVNFKYSLNYVEKKENANYLFYTETGVQQGVATAAKLLRTDDSLDLSKAVFISVANTSLTGTISMGDGKGYLYQDTNLIKWVVPKTDSAEELIKPIANITSTTLLKVIDGYLYFFSSTSELTKIKLPSEDWIANKDVTPWTDYKKELILGKDALDKMDTSWLKPVYMDGKWFFFNGGVDAFNKTKEDTDHVSMYYRAGYLFVYDTANAAKEDYVAERIGVLKSADKTEEEKKITEENKARDKKKK